MPAAGQPSEPISEWDRVLYGGARHRPIHPVCVICGAKVTGLGGMIAKPLDGKRLGYRCVHCWKAYLEGWFYPKYGRRE